MTKPRKIKSRGGSKNDTKYIYTRSENRGEWVDTIYPFGKIITSILPKINWSKFKYNGNFILEVTPVVQSSSSTKYSMPVKGDPIIQNDIEGILDVEGVPYEVFGGAACEIWASAYPEVPIRNYVDITGDIDVNVSLPRFRPADKYGGSYELDYYDVNPIMFHEGKYTPYGDAFTRWLFDEVVREFTKISPMFNIKELNPPRKDENPETILCDLEVTIGNLLITRHIYENNVVKIQVTTKVLPDIVNHMIEFLIAKEGRFQSKSKYAINGIYVQDLYSLLLSQVEGLRGRITRIRSGIYNDPISAPKLENHPFLYKFDNHCARLLYIANLMKYTEGKQFDKTTKFDYITKAQAISILEKLYVNDCNRACNIHFGPDYINKIIDIFETMKYIGKGYLTTKLHPLEKKLLNTAKASLGGRRTRKRK